MKFTYHSIFVVLLVFVSSLSAAQLIVADSGFTEPQDMGHIIYQNTPNVRSTMDSAFYTRGHYLSPFMVYWADNYWGSHGTLKDSVVSVLYLSSVDRFSFIPFRQLLRTPPPVYCPDDTIRAMFFRSGLYSGPSGAIALKLTQPLVKDSSYRIPFVYSYDGIGRTHTGTSFYDNKVFNFSVYTCDTSRVFVENAVKSAPFLDFDTIGNYEFIETVPYAHNGKWQRYWLEFTATATQDGHDWLILHDGRNLGILMNFVDAKRMIDVPLEDETLVYCSDTTVLLDYDTISIVDSSYIAFETYYYYDTFFYSSPDINGCRLADCREVVYQDKEAIVLATDSLCAYDSIDIVTEVVEHLQTTYLWNTLKTGDTLSHVRDTGVYWVDVSQGDCQFRDSIDIGYFDPVEFDLGNDTFFCIGDSILLETSINGAISYTWSNGEDSSHIYVDSSQKLYLTVANEHCIADDSIYLAQKELPTISLSSDTAFCSTDSVLVDVFEPTLLRYHWNDAVDTSARWIKDAGLYILEVSDTFCYNSDSIFVTTDNPLSFSLGPDSSFCEGLSWSKDYTLLAADEYTWNDGSTQPTYTSSSNEEVTLEVKNGECITSDSVFLTVINYPEFALGTDTVLCENDSISIGTDRSSQSFVWSDGFPGKNRWVKSEGLYKLTLSNEECSSSDSIAIIFDAIQDLDLGVDTSVCAGDIYVDAYVENAINYLWDDGLSSESRFLSETGIYLVEVTTRACGSLRDSIQFTLENCNCDAWVPTAFTPNPLKDDINTSFGPSLSCDVSDFSLSIFNRWGELIFISEDPLEKWDGTYRSALVQGGQYFWMLTYTMSGSSIVSEKGLVSVLR